MTVLWLEVSKALLDVIVSCHVFYYTCVIDSFTNENVQSMLGVDIVWFRWCHYTDLHYHTSNKCPQAAHMSTGSLKAPQGHHTSTWPPTCPQGRLHVHCTTHTSTGTGSPTGPPTGPMGHPKVQRTKNMPDAIINILLLCLMVCWTMSVPLLCMWRHADMMKGEQCTKKFVFLKRIYTWRNWHNRLYDATLTSCYLQ